jgi:excisionase family DNA binding protein
MDDTIKLLTARLDRIEQLTLIGAKNTLDLEEAALYTGYSKGQLYRLTSGRQIPHYKQSRKLYFSKTELDRWMQENRIATNSEIDSMASTYVATH